MESQKDLLQDHIMKKLKLYWWNRLDDGGKNFGDWLSPILCEVLSGMPVVHSLPDKCDLMAIGSILGKAKRSIWSRRIDIWGTGLIEDKGPFKSPHRIHAVRGWKTAARIQNRKISVVGDPGLLCSMLVPPGSAGIKKFSVGLIPHFVDKDHPLSRTLLEKIPHSKLIDVFSDPPEFIKQVASCEVILSSCLHGLIAADSLGIPNAWIKLSGDLRGSGFKFQDYYSVFGLEAVEPFALSPNTNIGDIHAIAETYCRPGINAIKDNLMRSFPFKK
jgi:hypothetical protein